jgi:hypothetical protein
MGAVAKRLVARQPAPAEVQLVGLVDFASVVVGVAHFPRDQVGTVLAGGDGYVGGVFFTPLEPSTTGPDTPSTVVIVLSTARRGVV